MVISEDTHPEVNETADEMAVAGVCLNLESKGNLENESDATKPSAKLFTLVSPSAKKSKLSRRKLFNNEEFSSPVLGLRILPANTGKTHSPDAFQSPTSSFGFTCKLCQTSFTDPLRLANHRCVRIENVQYTCPDCGKSFSCPANLASHRRWHKPKKNDTKTCQIPMPDTADRKGNVASQSSEKSRDGSGSISDACTTDASGIFSTRKTTDVQKNKAAFSCIHCGTRFGRKLHLKQHIDNKHSESYSTFTANSLPSKDGDPLKYTIPTSLNARNFEGLGGLETLAFAAEMHSRMSPEIRAFGKTIAVDRTKQKRPNADLVNVTSVSKFPKIHDELIWLPPSPPRSDLSSSPHSTVSEESDVKNAKEGTKLKGIVEPLKQVIVKPTPRELVPGIHAISNLIPSIPHTIATDSKLSSTHSIPKFQEPFHPFVFNSRVEGSALLPHWNSWAAYGSTAWRTPAYVPYFCNP